MTYLARLAIELKSVPCMDCVAKGGDGVWPPEAMTFDHRDYREKVAPIRTFIRNNDEPGFMAEIAKCDVICASCHNIRTKRTMPEIIKSQDGRHREVMTSPEVRAKLSEAGIRQGQDPEVQARKAASQREAMAERRSQGLRRADLGSVRDEPSKLRGRKRPELAANIQSYYDGLRDDPSRMQEYLNRVYPDTAEARALRTERARRAWETRRANKAKALAGSET